MAFQTVNVHALSSCTLRCRSLSFDPARIFDGSISISTFSAHSLRTGFPSDASRYSVPTRRRYSSIDLVSSEFPRKRMAADLRSPSISISARRRIRGRSWSSA